MKCAEMKKQIRTSFHRSRMEPQRWQVAKLSVTPALGRTVQVLSSPLGGGIGNQLAGGVRQQRITAG